MAKKAIAKKESDEFVSDDVESAGGAYTKWEDGSNKIRILTKPVIGWVVWTEDEEGNKLPSHTQINDEPENPTGEKKDAPKKFMALGIYNYAKKVVEVAEITQQSVIKAIKALAANPDWGHPFTYDITVGKKGSGMKTKYTVTPSPKKPLDKATLAIIAESPCNLDALFEEEGNVWDTETGATEYHFK